MFGILSRLEQRHCQKILDRSARTSVHSSASQGIRVLRDEKHDRVYTLSCIRYYNSHNFDLAIIRIINVTAVSPLLPL